MLSKIFCWLNFSYFKKKLSRLLIDYAAYKHTKHSIQFLYTFFFSIHTYLI